MAGKLEHAVSEVLAGMEPSRAANKYGVKVSQIREALASQEHDKWGHKSLETFVLRNSFNNASKAIAQWRGEVA